MEFVLVMNDDIIQEVQKKKEVRELIGWGLLTNTEKQEDECRTWCNFSEFLILRMVSLLLF